MLQALVIVNVFWLRFRLFLNGFSETCDDWGNVSFIEIPSFFFNLLHSNPLVNVHWVFFWVQWFRSVTTPSQVHLLWYIAHISMWSVSWRLRLVGLIWINRTQIWIQFIRIVALSLEQRLHFFLRQNNRTSFSEKQMVLILLPLDAILFFKWNCLRILGLRHDFTILNRSMDTV